MRIRRSILSLLPATLLVGASGCDPIVPHESLQTVTERFADDHVAVLHSQSYLVGFQIVAPNEPRTALAAPPLNQPFDIKVAVADRSNEFVQVSVQLSVDAGMPEHGHGMNVKPTITRRKDGSFLVEGMLFHMPGRWELYFDITRGGMTERAQTEFNLE